MAAGKNGKKVGKNKTNCTAYANRNQRERNKARKMRRYLKRHPQDEQCAKALEALYKRFSFLKRA